MNLLNYIRIECPKVCGVHPAYGRVAELIYNDELQEDSEFRNENFESLRERAKLGLPFKPINKEAYEHCLDVLELVLCIHRQEKHNENYEQRINELKQIELTKEEADMVANPEGFWSG
jgi:hypothetical protein